MLTSVLMLGLRRFIPVEAIGTIADEFASCVIPTERPLDLRLVVSSSNIRTSSWRRERRPPALRPRTPMLDEGGGLEDPCIVIEEAAADLV